MSFLKRVSLPLEAINLNGRLLKVDFKWEMLQSEAMGTLTRGRTISPERLAGSPA